MKKNPKISVIMSVYNGMPYLEEAARSILHQTYKNFEFIIVDDASKDKSWQFVRNLKDKRIKVIRNKKNLGLAASLNLALRLAQSDFIARMDADDISLSKRLETQLAFMLKNPKIDIWRKTYSIFGAKPKENKSSVENIYRLVLRGINIRHINKIVDIYNLISLKHMMPVGGEDIDKMKGNINLTFAELNEAPVLLLGDKDPRPPHAGEVIYKDDVSTICRRWNWREADRTKLTEETKNCILVVEGLSPVTKQEIEAATKELKDLIREFCGGTLSSYVLDKNKTEVEF